MELDGSARAITAPEDNNAALKNLDEFKKYGQYKIQGVSQVGLQTAESTTRSNVTGLSPTITEVYGSSTTAGSKVGVENTSCTPAANDMSLNAASLMQGLIKDETHGSYKCADKRLFGGAYIVISKNHGFPVYYVLLYYTFTPSLGVDIQTDAANPVTVHDPFTVTPQARPVDNLLYQIFVGGTNADPAQKNEESMLEYTINGLQKTGPSH